MSKWAVPLGILIAISVAAYLFISGKHDGESQSISPVIQRFVAAEGKIEARRGFEADVGSEIDGVIAEFPVEEGDTVKKGDLIARIDNADIAAKLKETEAALIVAKAKLDEVESGARQEEIRRAAAARDGAKSNAEIAEKEFTRYSRLFKAGMVSASDVDEQKRKMEMAEAQFREASEELKLLEMGPKEETVRFYRDEVTRSSASVEYLKAVLDKTIIVSPVDGKVVQKNFSRGEMISKEMQSFLVKVADINKIWVNAEIDETDVGRISIGDSVEVTSDAFPGKVFPGKVEEIADYVGARRVSPNNPAKNLDMKVVQVKIGLGEKVPLKLGMTVDVRIIPGEKQTQ